MSLSSNPRVFHIHANYKAGRIVLGSIDRWCEQNCSDLLTCPGSARLIAVSWVWHCLQLGETEDNKNRGNEIIRDNRYTSVAK